MNRNLAMEFVRVTEMSAIASARLMGRGDEKAADFAAIEAMRTMLDSVECKATVIIGQGDESENSMLYVGEQVGSNNGPELEIALDPLEGSSICATGGNNAISVMAIGEKGNLLHAPDTYMKKIAAGAECRNIIDITLSVSENLKRVAEVKSKRVQDVTAIILDRPRHQDIIDEVRSSGARIALIKDGDISAAIATCNPDSGVDILFGTGGASEGVIAAAALRCVGGVFQGVFMPSTDREKEQILSLGVAKLDTVFSEQDLASGNVLFAATGVTDGNLLEGVKFKSWGATTHSVVMRSESGTIRHIRAEHHFDTKPRY